MKYSHLVAIALVILPAQIGHAQIRTQADVSVQRIDAQVRESRFTCRVTVHSFHDDTARQAQLRLLLPVGVRVVSIEPAEKTSSCSASTPARDGTQGLVSCDLGDLDVNQTRSVSIATTVPPEFVPRSTCAALVWSETPDPEVANNHRESTANK
ncbi:MAG: hypothetical protein AAF481_13980 [Acidobacteriota bacterium]